MTVTYPAIEAAREVLWLVTGADKTDALAKLKAADPSIPAGRVRARQATLLGSAEAIGGKEALERVGGALDPVARGDDHVGDQGRGEEAVVDHPRSSSAIGAVISPTGFAASAITTKRSAAAATIFSRVWAPPPPLTSQPSAAT